MDKIAPMYQYQSLEAQEIRLLVLLPGSSFDDIQCKLKNVSLSDKPTYEALSYAWGDSAKTKSVLCDEKHIFITESLFVALQHLAYEEEPRCMWADAICINQASHAEKNHQVALMGQIYSQAEKTIVWIGEDENNEAGYAFALIEACGLVGLLNEGLEKIHTVMRSMPNSMASSSEITNIDQAIEAFLVGVCPIFKKDWFNRLWVVQEVVLAERADMVFGFHSIQLDMVYSVMGNLLIKLYRTHRPISMPGIRSVENFIQTGDMRDRTQNEESEPYPLAILEFLRKTENRKCSDKRDKIYGLLGMASVPGFHANYTLDVDEVYVQFATWALKSLNGFIIFACASRIENASPNIPTWAPGPKMLPLACPLTWKSYNGFHPASLSRKMSERAQNLYSLKNARYLHIQGYMLSIVQETVPASSIAQSSRTLQRSLAAAAELAGFDVHGNHDLEDEMHTRFASAMDFYGQFKKCDWTDTEFSHKQRLERLSDFFLNLTKILNGTAQETINKKLERFIYNYRQVSDQRLFGRSGGDRFIWVPMTAEQGDQICIIRGALVPHVIRVQSNGNYKMVGECWVEDFMNGQALSLPDFQWTKLCLE